MKTIRLSDGKYEFDLDERGLMVAARRHGEDWAAGFEMRFSGVFMSALWELDELRDAVSAYLTRSTNDGR